MSDATHPRGKVVVLQAEIQIDDTGKNPDVTADTFGDALHIAGRREEARPMTGRLANEQKA